MMKSARLPVVLVLAIGALQLVGYVLHFEPLRRIGQITAASPLPLVFSHFRGLETFTPKFEVVVNPGTPAAQVIALTPDLYARFSGPYNRRNIYGVAFAFGAVLQEPNERALVEGVLRYGFCSGGPLRELLAEVATLTPEATLTIRIRPKGGAPIELPVECHP